MFFDGFINYIFETESTADPLFTFYNVGETTRFVLLLRGSSISPHVCQDEVDLKVQVKLSPMYPGKNLKNITACLSRCGTRSS